MRKIVLALSALAVVGFALPLTTPANAEEKIVIKKHRDHDWDRHHHKTVIIKHKHDHDND